MTRILAVADLHIGAGAAHRRDHLADTERTLNQIADLHTQRRADLLVIAGDVFHRPKPNPAELHIFARFLNRITGPVIAIHGNAGHDLVNGDEPTALELFSGGQVMVSRRPEVLEAAGVQVVTLPAVPPYRLRAMLDGGGEGEVGDLTVSLLMEAARFLVGGCDRGRPRILVGHWSVGGASLPNGLPVGGLSEPVLPLDAVEDLDVDAAVFGHVHMPQTLVSSPDLPVCPVFYCGSPMVHDFGEAAHDHGVWVVEAGGPLGTDAEFVPIPGRKFVTVDVDLTVPSRLDPADMVADAIAEQFPLADAVLRVRYRATEEQHRRVDHGALRRLVDDAGVHRLHGGFHWEPVRARRVRAEGIGESLDYVGAVRAWCAACDVPEDQADALLTLTRELLTSDVPSAVAA